MHNFKMFAKKSLLNDLKTAFNNGDSIAQVLADYFPWIEKIQNIMRKIKDYDRLEGDYSVVICECTNSKLSKTNYETGVVIEEIQRAQQESTEEIIKDDLLDIINKTKGMERINLLREYVGKLWKN